MANLTMHNIKLQGQVLLGSLPSNPAYHATSAPNGSMWFNSTTGKLMMMVAGSAAVIGDAADITALSSALNAEIVRASAAEAATQADVDANELDGDNDRAAIRSEFAAADATLKGDAAAAYDTLGKLEDKIQAEAVTARAAEAAIQADVNTNESDGDTDRAAIRSEFAVADAAEVVSRNAAITTAVNNLIDSAPGTLDTLNELAAALGDDADFHTSMTAVHTAATTDRALIRTQFAAADAVLKGDAAAAYDTLGKLEDKIQAEAVTARAAEAAIQADVNTNESDGDTDRALIRTQFAAADAAVQAELDATQSSMGSLMSVAGAYVPFALGGGAYIDGNSSLTEDLVDLDTGLINEVSLARSNEATIQADVDANELDGDNDRALIRSQFAAADAVLKGDAAAAYDTLGKLEDKIQAEAVTARAAEAAIQADVNQNEVDADAAIAAVQADVNANELDGDNDRALIRSQFATADAAVQAELDATQAAMGSLMSGAGAYVAFALGGGAYIDGNSSLTEDLVDLDTGLINEVSRAGSAEASIQADIDANELDGDNDRALIRSQFAAADAAEVVSRNAAITTAVNNLIDSAPGTLDTLNELAAALGDDADFHTSMTAVHTAATTDRALIRTQFAAADAAIQSELDATQASMGSLMSGAGAYVPFALGGGAYIDGNSSLTEDLVDLDTGLINEVSLARSNEATNAAAIAAEAVTARAAEVANAAATAAEAVTARAAEVANAASITAITARFTTVSASGGSYDGSGDHSVQLTHSLSDSAPFVQVMVGGVMMMAPVTFDSASAVTVTLKGVANAAVGTVLVNFFSVA